jgi:FeS assembly SUF system protein
MWGREKKAGDEGERNEGGQPTGAMTSSEVATEMIATAETLETPAAASASSESVAGDPDVSDDPVRIRDRIIAVLKTVYDPEIPVDIYELGLVYGVEVTDDAEVHVTMTLTTPMCPVAETLPPEVEEKVRNVMGVKDVTLDLVWDPPWSIEMMSDAARLELNLM